MSPSTAAARYGLSIAHPGHELRLTRWIETRRPTVFVLTSGSRSGDDRTRVTASGQLLATLGACPGALFGRWLDREVYEWIMRQESWRFSSLVDELATQIVSEKLDVVVTDAWQLYNVVHDLWHLVTRAAVTKAARQMAKPVACYDFPVVPPRLAYRPMGPVRETISLAADELRRKLDLAADFPAMSGDVAEILEAGGAKFVATESLHEPAPAAFLLPRNGEKPGYEDYGERRVRSGQYATVLRWAHAAPVATHLLNLIGVAEPSE